MRTAKYSAVALIYLWIAWRWAGYFLFKYPGQYQGGGPYPAPVYWTFFTLVLFGMTALGARTVRKRGYWKKAMWLAEGCCVAAALLALAAYFVAPDESWPKPVFAAEAVLVEAAVLLTLAGLTNLAGFRGGARVFTLITIGLTTVLVMLGFVALIMDYAGLLGYMEGILLGLTAIGLGATVAFCAAAVTVMALVRFHMGREAPGAKE